jgi:hypothetical protein
MVRDLSVSYNLMGDLYRALGRGDLAILLADVGITRTSAGQRLLGRAPQILRTLDAQGRLMEEDKPKIPQLEAMISPMGSTISLARHASLRLLGAIIIVGFPNLDLRLLVDLIIRHEADTHSPAREGD